MEAAATVEAAPQIIRDRSGRVWHARDLTRPGFWTSCGTPLNVHTVEVKPRTNDKSVSCRGCRARLGLDAAPPVVRGLAPVVPLVAARAVRRGDRRAPLGGHSDGEARVSIRKNYGNPAHRVKKDVTKLATENLQHAHKAVVVALEWQQRGEPGQFTDQMLDQAMLGYRFLGELLARHGRIEDDGSFGDD